MKYHAPTKQFTISQKDLESATYSFLYAIRHIRDLACLPHTPYTQAGLLSDADHAQKGIIDAAKFLGIDLGAEW